MTKITHISNDRNFYIKAEGHATGNERVCAAVSGIMYALAGWLVNVKDENSKLPKALDKEPRIVMRDGFSDIEFSGGAEARAVYDMTLIGLFQLEAAEPEYVRCERDGLDKK